MPVSSSDMDITKIRLFSRQATPHCQVKLLDGGGGVSPEELAMLQALHSRSAGGVEDHLKDVERRGADNFMGMYYVGYGDKSIGDCGVVPLFIEGCSMLCAKAIQGYMLYNGQERSTRYGNFGEVPWMSGSNAGTAEQVEALDGLRLLYKQVYQEAEESVALKHPYQPDMGVTEGEHRKAVKARAFDIARALLPAGAVTNLSWFVDIRHCNDHLRLLRNHPLKEVNDVAAAIEGLLSERYPSSFKMKRYQESESYTRDVMYDNLVLNHMPWEKAPVWDAEGTVKLVRDGLDVGLLTHWSRHLSNRPPKTELDKCVAQTGTMTFVFPLDFASWRDLQRHRSLVQPMLLPSMTLGMHKWYLNQMRDLPSYDKVINTLFHLAEVCSTSYASMPYHVPMGCQVMVPITGDLPALIWLLELRTTKAVHPTLRIACQSIAKILNRRICPAIPEFKLHVDWSPDGFHPPRGKQDIIAK